MPLTESRFDFSAPRESRWWFAQPGAQESRWSFAWPPVESRWFFGTPPVESRWFFAAPSEETRFYFAPPDTLQDVDVVVTYNGNGTAVITATITADLTAALPLQVSVFGPAGPVEFATATTATATTITAVVREDEVYTLDVLRANSSVVAHALIVALPKSYACIRRETRPLVIPGHLTPRWEQMIARLVVIPPMVAAGNVEGAREHIAAMLATCAQTPDCQC